IESVAMADRWFPGIVADTMAFHRNTLERDGIMADLLLDHLDVCTRFVDSRLILCTRTGLPFAASGTETFPSFIAFAQHPETLRVASDRVTFAPGGALRGRLGTLPAGRYEWTMRGDGDVDLEVLDGDAVVASGRGTLRFAATGRPLGYRATAPRGAAITGSRI